MLRRIVLVSLVASAFALAASGAHAWIADYFDKDSSGNASYEEMAIAPQAVYDQERERTYIAFQGNLLNPYITAYDHPSGRWFGPYMIGTNSLAGDLHGAPSLVIDADGYIFVFYGGHLTQMGHSRSARPHDISEWVDLGPVKVGSPAVTIAASYPQPVLQDDGSIRLYYRCDRTGETYHDWKSVVSTGAALAPQWVAPETVIDSAMSAGATETIEAKTTAVYYEWYINVEDGGTGTPAFAAVRRDRKEPGRTADNYYVRKGVYYAERSVEGSWTNVTGDKLAVPLRYSSLDTTADVRPETRDEYTNQVVLRRNEAGEPAVLYLKGPWYDTRDPYEWRLARWSSTESTWTDTLITTTDDFFDAGTFEFMPNGDIEAFLTTGGMSDDQWLLEQNGIPAAQLAKRGGDITWWRLRAGEAKWVKVDDIITSPGPHARYNNPQIVRGYRHGNGEARLLFSEWNNDASNFIHKVYLWGNGTFKQRAFTPEITRLAGPNRIETAIAISRQAFPLGADNAVLATGSNFPDALCGVPLAQALSAPVLLSNATNLPESVVTELDRLNVEKVFVLGGEPAISAAVEADLRKLKGPRGVALKVERISGANRYETSAKIADELAERRGVPTDVIIASGESFPDALTVSPYAARRGWPVLLTPKERVHAATVAAVESYAPERIIIIGSDAAVTVPVEDAYSAAAFTYSERWEGPNRYATAAVIAQHAVDDGHSLERFALATGLNYADAVSGGLLAARMNGVLLITPTDYLHPEASAVLDELSFGVGTGVLDAYILGGEPALSVGVANELAARLTYLDTRATR